jgi:hypothetical protein
MEENPILIAHAKELCNACGMPLYEAIEAIKRVSKPHVFIGVDIARGRDFSGPLFLPHLIDAAVGRWEKKQFDPTRAWAAMQLPKETLFEVKKRAYAAATDMIGQISLPKDHYFLTELKRTIINHPKPKKNALRFLDGLGRYSKRKMR